MAPMFLALLAVGVGLQAPSSGIGRVAWLQGCWESAERSGSIVEEQWMAPRGGTMLGMGRTVRDGRLVEYEFVLLEEDGAGLAYEAHPSGQPPATFRAKTISASSVVFENLEHDFPQRVGYERDGAALTAWIEGTQNGRVRRIDFRYREAPCRPAQ